MGLSEPLTSWDISDFAYGKYELRCTILVCIFILPGFHLTPPPPPALWDDIDFTSWLYDSHINQAVERWFGWSPRRGYSLPFSHMSPMSPTCRHNGRWKEPTMQQNNRRTTSDKGKTEHLLFYGVDIVKPYFFISVCFHGNKCMEHTIRGVARRPCAF